jgi:acyl carrier protein
VTGLGRFVERLADELELDIECESVDASTPLAALELDSIHLLELWAFFDEAGVEVPEDLFATWETVGDLHHHFSLHDGRLTRPDRSSATLCPG